MAASISVSASAGGAISIAGAGAFSSTSTTGITEAVIGEGSVVHARAVNVSSTFDASIDTNVTAASVSVGATTRPSRTWPLFTASRSAPLKSRVMGSDRMRRWTSKFARILQTAPRLSGERV